MAKEIAVERPLRIDEVSYLNLEATFSGVNWSLAMICPWRLLLNGSVVVDPEKMEQSLEVETEIVADAIWELIGYDIVGVKESPSNPTDPIFELTGGYSIEVIAGAELDPWALELSKIVFVGPTSPNTPTADGAEL